MSWKVAWLAYVCAGRAARGLLVERSDLARWVAGRWKTACLQRWKSHSCLGAGGASAPFAQVALLPPRGTAGNILICVSAGRIPPDTEYGQMECGDEGARDETKKSACRSNDEFHREVWNYLPERNSFLD